MPCIYSALFKMTQFKVENLSQTYFGLFFAKYRYSILFREYLNQCPFYFSLFDKTFFVLDPGTCKIKLFTLANTTTVCRAITSVTKSHFPPQPNIFEHGCRAYHFGSLDGLHSKGRLLDLPTKLDQDGSLQAWTYTLTYYNLLSITNIKVLHYRSLCKML